MDLRKCKFNSNSRLNDDFDKTWQEGKFHKWGCEYEEFDNGPGNFTIAIVEDAKGFIHTVLPSCIYFIDTGKQ